MNMSISESVYNAISNKALTCEEISIKTGADMEYIRALLSRWKRNDVIVYGEPKGSLKTYTAVGAANWPNFRSGFWRSENIVLDAVGAKPKSVVDIVANTGLHSATVRKALAALVRSGEVAREAAKQNKYMYRRK